jgi:uncharacterized protein YjbI with pentapeptide repeats
MQNKLTTTCQYEFLLAPRNACPHPPLAGDLDNYCLFHSDDDKKKIKVFWKGIQGKLKNGDFDFAGYYFPPGLTVDFGGKGFKDADFSGAIFKGDVNFRRAEFSGKSTSFYGAEFSKDANFSEATFKGDVDFSRAEFSGESTSFCIAKFSGKTTDFGKAKFSEGSTDFRAAEFSGKGTYFYGARFSGKITSFDLAIFFSEEITTFHMAEFSGEKTRFVWAEFSGKSISFSGAEFSGESTDFSSADFSECGTTHFVDTVFKGECKFLMAEFPLKSDQFVIFWGTIYPLELSKTVFHYCNSYDRIIFRNCKFSEGPDEQFGLWWRKVILNDELFVYKKELELIKQKAVKEEGEKQLPEESLPNLEAESERIKVEYSHVESLYRQFKKNLEAEKDWELAGEFHYGEMECKRKGITSQWPQLKWLRQNLGLLAWYKYFSGYGERPFRTLCWIVFLLPFFAVLYSGIDWWLDPPRQCFWNHYFWNISVKAAFLQRIGETGSEPTSLLGKLVYLFQSALCPTLIALFILALRRKVKR